MCSSLFSFRPLFFSYKNLLQKKYIHFWEALSCLGVDSAQLENISQLTFTALFSLCFILIAFIRLSYRMGLCCHYDNSEG